MWVRWRILDERAANESTPLLSRKSLRKQINNNWQRISYSWTSTHQTCIPGTNHGLTSPAFSPLGCQQKQAYESTSPRLL